MLSFQCRNSGLLGLGGLVVLLQFIEEHGGQQMIVDRERLARFVVPSAAVVKWFCAKFGEA